MNNRLCHEIIGTNQIDDTMCKRMFALFARCYDSVSQEAFEKDLQEKSFLVVLRDGSDRLCGFSTQQIIPWTFRNERVSILYSGDTIIEPEFWGSSELVKGWCKVAAQELLERPDQQLYWVLISKGYRTYLYLPLFFKRYLPRIESNTPEEWQVLCHEIASGKFGDAYDPERGIIHFPKSRGNLKTKLAGVPSGRIDDPNVRYFLERNPGYRTGDELTCFAEISLENTHGLGRRWLKHAMADLCLA